MATKNYTLGRGKVYVSRFNEQGVADGAYRYIGNTPEFSLNIESESLDHFSSDEGIREKDDSVQLEVTRTGSLTTDNIDPNNVAMFFFGTAEIVAQAAVASTSETFTGIEAGRSYKLGVTSSNPAGYFGIDEAGFSVTAGATPMEAGVDYTVDYMNGMIHLLETSEVAVDGVDITVEYAVAASTRSRVISGSEPVECAIRYITKNPKGTDSQFFMPHVKLTPNGDYALKGDEWQQIPLSMEILKPTGGEAIYRDGNPVLQ